MSTHDKLDLVLILMGTGYLWKADKLVGNWFVGISLIGIALLPWHTP